MFRGLGFTVCFEQPTNTKNDAVRDSHVELMGRQVAICGLVQSEVAVLGTC